MSTSASRGLVAGFIAAAVFAAWFLLVDVVQGQPFATPAYMSGLLFSFTTALPATARLAAFTLIHFLVFGVIGVIVSVLSDRGRWRPMLSLGIVLGFLLFDIVFYGSVLLLGVNIVRALGWPQVLTANMAAGVALFGYLRVRAGLPLLTIGRELREHDRVRRGLIAGTIGAAAVAAWFFVLDAIQGPMFYTPAALGSAIFFGASSPGEIVVSLPVVLGYTLVHFAAFMLVGLGIEWLMAEAERHTPALLGMVLLVVTFEVASIGVLSLVASWLFETLAWWSPLVANLLAAAAMVGYLWREHPALRTRMGEPLEEELAAIGG
jgi:hypothetical protein